MVNIVNVKLTKARWFANRFIYYSVPVGSLHPIGHYRPLTFSMVYDLEGWRYLFVVGVQKILQLGMGPDTVPFGVDQNLDTGIPNGTFKVVGGNLLEKVHAYERPIGIPGQVATGGQNSGVFGRILRKKPSSRFLIIDVGPGIPDLRTNVCSAITVIPGCCAAPPLTTWGARLRLAE